ncbi:hypothetical protein [Brevundimonas subvibrioides]|uniref:Uncharacterized protein n=1 Tax=Brevundimonas subvibrioides (strain ATCC 15264 / DSM 4735 / LMG 14903 / NBRC 16000 / CB 81) TaxID=633149 RepID=D9QIC8_BRESC|nr:hypothetical protein [Brevundimonas subvibrioides]ADK99430.1 hypothetical protein Bresu_0116 [Brevundimonas subvibrioides ATCC 15264]
MMLSTTSGTFPIPPDVAARLPWVPPVPNADAPDYEVLSKALTEWLDESPTHLIDFERLRRWHLVQEDLAAEAASKGVTYQVTADGLD